LGKVVVGLTILVVIFRIVRPQSGPTEGSRAKALDLPWVTGAAGRLQSRDLEGSVVVIEAFAGWCGTCKRSTPELNRVASGKRRQPARFIGVSLDSSADEARRTVGTWKLSFPVALADEKFRSEYQINVLPTTVVVDAKGVIRHASSGAIDISTLESWLRDLGAGRD
jgi:thiol-disulfide isomerase/thioredoxin